MKKAFVEGFAVFATVTQRNVHFERRCYCLEGNDNEYYIKVNGNFYKVGHLRKLGNKVDIWF